jgi:hypothetical protein
VTVLVIIQFGKQKKKDGPEPTPQAQWKPMDPVNTHKDTFEVLGRKSIVSNFTYLQRSYSTLL